jgi:hypothetical protein
MIITKLTKGESYGVEIDSQEILLLDGGQSHKLRVELNLIVMKLINLL